MRWKYPDNALYANLIPHTRQYPQHPDNLNVIDTAQSNQRSKSSHVDQELRPLSPLHPRRFQVPLRREDFSSGRDELGVHARSQQAHAVRLVAAHGPVVLCLGAREFSDGEGEGVACLRVPVYRDVVCGGNDAGNTVPFVSLQVSEMPSVCRQQTLGWRNMSDAHSRNSGHVDLGLHSHSWSQSLDDGL